MGGWILIAVLFALLALAGWGSYEGWMRHSDVAMPASGYFAMTLGIVLSVVVGCGLMILVFYSSRKGYDEPAERDVDEREDH